ncbi:MAG: hypothetical protein NTX50_21955 [Candidatus Sumerlaeota bacterium]|nr:hypothetical protein [Candidatus Sumerlaeota bacterium]
MKFWNARLSLDCRFRAGGLRLEPASNLAADVFDLFRSEFLVAARNAAQIRR